MSIEAAGDCPRCKEFKVWGASTCRCTLFDCGEPWKGNVEDWSPIYAIDAQTAAEKFAQWTDCHGAEYAYIKNNSGEVWTRDADGVIRHWDIEAEAVPTYYAREKPQKAAV